MPDLLQQVLVFAVSYKGLSCLFTSFNEHVVTENCEAHGYFVGEGVCNEVLLHVLGTDHKYSQTVLHGRHLYSSSAVLFNNQT